MTRQQVIDHAMNARTADDVRTARDEVAEHLRKHPNDYAVMVAGNQLAKVGRILKVAPPRHEAVNRMIRKAAGRQ